jgi:N-acetylglucosamine kinase-like BadF-type ATPase
VSARILAVDGGQSGIRVLDSSTGVTTELKGVSRLEGDPLMTIVESLRDHLQSSPSNAPDVIVLGLSTVPNIQRDGESFARQVLHALDAPRVVVTDDAVTHHASVFQGKPGVGLAIGTGVACTAVDDRGHFHSVSGYGFLLGDDGGAFWIGREAIRRVLDSFPRGRTSAMRELVESEWGDLAVLPATLHSLERPVNEIAHLAPHVLALADDDADAGAVIQAAIDALVEAANRAVSSGGGIDAPRMVWTSKLFSSSPRWSEALSSALLQGVSSSTVTASNVSPLEGALWLADPDHHGPYSSHLIDVVSTEGVTHVP